MRNAVEVPDDTLPVDINEQFERRTLQGKKNWARVAAIQLEGKNGRDLLILFAVVILFAVFTGQFAGLFENHPSISEERKRQIFYDLVVAEDKADREALQRHPVLNPLNPSMDYARLYNKLEKEYKEDVARKYGLSQEQVDEIIVEGVMNEWPMPDF